MDTITIKVKIEFNDIKEFTIYDLKKKPLVKFQKIFAVIIFAIIMFLFSGNPKFWDLALFSILLLVFVFILLPYIILSKKRSGFETNKSYHSPIIYTITKDFISSIGEGTFETKIGWDKFFKAIEQKNFFVLYFNNSSAVILPKRFINEKDQIKFRRILQLNNLLGKK